VTLPNDGLNLPSTDLVIIVGILNDGVMEGEETATLTLIQTSSQEQGEYLISTLNITIAADQRELSRAYIYIYMLIVHW